MYDRIVYRKCGLISSSLSVTELVNSENLWLMSCYTTLQTSPSGDTGVNGLQLTSGGLDRGPELPTALGQQPLSSVRGTGWSRTCGIGELPDSHPSED